MKLVENMVYTLPKCDASIMKIVAKLMNEDGDTLLETRELNVELSMVSYIGECRSTSKLSNLGPPQRRPCFSFFISYSFPGKYLV